MPPHIPKLKTVFLLVVTFNILVVLLMYSGQQTNIFFTSKNSAQLSEHNSEFSSGREIRFLDLRTIDAEDSIEEFDYLLNVRKLILFAVHELNKPLKYTNCAKWWANPLDLHYHKERIISTTHAKHLIHFIKFRIQPGNLKVVVTIRQQTTTIRLGDRELDILGIIKIQPSFKGKRCYNERLRKSAVKTCLCVNSKQFQQYNKITTELRKKWNKMDRELKTWPPNKSFVVTDYMNLTDYEWFITSPGNTKQDVANLRYSTEYCGPDIKMLVMVCSAPLHFEQRRTIRETYASSSNLKGKGIKVVFLMGIPSDSKLNDDVKREADEWKDIIQANFHDSYHNVTISHLSMYKWAHLNCIGANNSEVTVPQFILKADDDFLLNVDLALEVAHQNSEYEFIGALFCGGKAVRNVAYMDKYYTPRYMHISQYYGGYLSGVVYTLRTDVIPLLLHMSITTPLIHMDDAYVSGVLLRQLKIQPRHSELFSYDRIDPDPCKSKRSVSSYVLDSEDMIAQWDIFVKPMPANCTQKDLNMTVEKLSEKDMQACFFNYK